MSVRAWFTISAVILLLLAGAFAYWLFAPTSPPAILARAGDDKLNGVYARSCWPQRTGDVTCKESDGSASSDATVIARRGKMRLVTAFHVQPDDGSIKIETDNGKTVIEAPWSRELNYALDPGRYTLTAEARYADDAFVRYVFRLRVA